MAGLVLCYHAVSATWKHGLSIAPSTLERQLGALLQRGFTPGTAADAIAGRRRLLHVTFDDAFTSVAAAVPVLERLSVPATVFACSAFADAGRPLEIAELADEAAAHPDELQTMSWEELRELASRGVEIGSHTVTHAHLPQLDDRELDAELRSSRTQIEDELGRPCRYLAYPYGEEDVRVHAAAARAGYEAAFALPGRESPRDRFALPRVGVYRRDSMFRFTLKTVAPVRRLARVAGRQAA